MKLVYDPQRRQDLFVVNDRTDGDPVINAGETFEVDDARGRELLGLYFPQLKPAPGTIATADKPLSAKDIIEKDDESQKTPVVVDVSNVNVADRADE